ncbi:CD276 antigen, partial [Clarias magur]
GCFQALLFALLIRVSEQRIHVVHATLGETVILPCSTNQINSNVYWRYGEKTTVCDIIKGEVDFEEQDPVYKDRVESFPLEFAKGNFSIKLIRVKRDFEGIYTCNFPAKLHPESVKLKIK